jgi:hypothetical protein
VLNGPSVSLTLSPPSLSLSLSRAEAMYSVWCTVWIFILFGLHTRTHTHCPRALRRLRVFLAAVGKICRAQAVFIPSSVYRVHFKSSSENKVVMCVCKQLLRHEADDRSTLQLNVCLTHLYSNKFKVNWNVIYWSKVLWRNISYSENLHEHRIWPCNSSHDQ